MSDPESLDAHFQEAVAAIDTGDVERLESLIAASPSLVRDRLDAPGPWLVDKVGRATQDFFKRPYLLWFVAEDPVRNGKLPPNIADVARTIIDAARRRGVPSLQEQLDYALTLVCWSWIARECGVQIALIDVLVDAGAALDGNPNNALVNSNVAAAEHLVRRGAALTLEVALYLGLWGDVDRLLAHATPQQKTFALVLSALGGKADALRRLIRDGVDINAPSPNLYPHGTPLHHAVSSGNLESVEVVVNAGGAIDAADTAWHGTPLGWAEHYISESKEPKQYREIAAYLRACR